MIVSGFTLGLLASESMSLPTPLKENFIVALSISSPPTHPPPIPHFLWIHYSNKTPVGVSGNLHVAGEIAQASLDWIVGQTQYYWLPCPALYSGSFPVFLLFLCQLWLWLLTYSSQHSHLRNVVREALFPPLTQCCHLRIQDSVISFLPQFQLSLPMTHTCTVPTETSDLHPERPCMSKWLPNRSSWMALRYRELAHQITYCCISRTRNNAWYIAGNQHILVKWVSK